MIAMSVLNKTWHIKNTDQKVPLLQKLLANRGLRTESEIEMFFHPKADRDFHDPFLMRDMRVAVDRIGEAIERAERIMIFGDYDVDGITGCAILMRALRKLSANVSYRLPHRIEDGYGMREKFISESKKLDVKIIITVDNGISCLDEIELANRLGIDVIITDHHTVPEKIPNAYAILHPKLVDSVYPFTELTGAGVALKLAQALLLERIQNREEASGYITSLLDLACMGTIADLGELRGENRYIVKEGLKALEHTRWPGLSRLKEYAGVKGKIDTHAIGFLLGPRINAAGRISHASHALRLLLHDEVAGTRQCLVPATLLADKLERLNQKRQKLMEKLMDIALVLAEKQASQPVIIIHHPEFHGGLIGLLATKLTEKYLRPAIVMEQRKDVFVGSCRSIRAVNIVEVLTKVKDLLSHFGGHAAAAGFDLPKENLDAFILGITSSIKIILGKDIPKDLLSIDCELSQTDVSQKTLGILEWFEPFGVGNEKPRFLCTDVPVHQYDTVGREGKHLKIKTRFNDMPIDCIGFRLGEYAHSLNGHRSIDIVCEIEEDNWNGNKLPKLKILDFKHCID